MAEEIYHTEMMRTMSRRVQARILRLSWLLLIALAPIVQPNLHAQAPQTNGTSAGPDWLTQPMSLSDALYVALRQNANVLRAMSDLEAAEGLAMETKAIALPRLRGSGEYEHTEAVEEIDVGDSTRLESPKDEWSGNIRIRQPIYQGGRLKAALRTAKLTREEALMFYYAAVADSLLEVRTGYYDVLLAEQQILVHEAEVKLLSEELQNTTRRFEAGAVPRFDVLRGEVAVANAKPRLIRARNSHRIAKNRLATLLGYNIPAMVWEDIPMTLTDRLHAAPYKVELPVAIAQALGRRPELSALQKSVDLRKERVRAAKGENRPWFSIFAGYDARNSQFSERFNDAVSGPIAGVEMTWEIWDSGATKGRVRQAEAFVTKAEVALDDTMRRVEQEVRTAYSRFIEAQETLESQAKVQERAQESLRLAISRYDAGTGTQLDVLDAQTALTEASATQVEALRNYLVARAELERAIGQDIPAIKEGKR